ncbi:LLM class F420-dependent oxidoreductase [Streptomyces sp. NPDC050485]|uniref:LLM class F420-dependent oxidoreductase n=1 Tax=Streptomyces sp. NPDC050485 TaxID=3365617 RepID=UPI0037BCB7BA
MRLCILTEPQSGASYDDVLRVARAAEDLGFEGFFRADHYVPIGGGDGRPGPTDTWITLAGLARETSTIRLGSLMTSATFRAPGPLAISVAQADHMSGGRIELGLGAGWYEPEHTAYGIPFPDVAERFDRFEEQLAIITGLWETPEGETFDHVGTYYTLTDSPGLPKPLQRPRPPLLIGGYGTRRTPRLAARYADEFNLAYPGFGQVAEAFDRVRRVCAEVDRSESSLAFSVSQAVCCGRDSAEIARRAPAGRAPESLREKWLVGTPDEVVDKIGKLGELGASRVYLRTHTLGDIDQLELLAHEVLRQVGTGS